MKSLHKTCKLKRLNKTIEIRALYLSKQVIHIFLETFYNHHCIWNARSNISIKTLKQKKCKNQIWIVYFFSDKHKTLTFVKLLFILQFYRNEQKNFVFIQAKKALYTSIIICFFHQMLLLSILYLFIKLAFLK